MSRRTETWILGILVVFGLVVGNSLPMPKVNAFGQRPPVAVVAGPQVLSWTQTSNAYMVVVTEVTAERRQQDIAHIITGALPGPHRVTLYATHKDTLYYLSEFDDQGQWLGYYGPFAYQQARTSLPMVQQ